MASRQARFAINFLTPLSGPMRRATTPRMCTRLAVRRRFAGGETSLALLGWAVEPTASLGRRYLRLDCEVERARFYERFGFKHHSDRQVGAYHVARYEYAVDDDKVNP